MRQCLQSFSKINLGLINRMIVLPARPHLVYTWAVSDVSIVICHTSGSQRLNEMDSEHPIQQELLLPKSPENFSPSLTTNYVGHWPNVIHTWSLRTFIFFITT